MRASGARRRRPSPYPQSVTTAKASPKRRRYVMGLSALAIAVAVTGGYMSTSTAYAEGDEHTITFNGNCGIGGLLQKSEPDKSELSVEEGQKVTFVNNLGTPGLLKIGSEELQLEKGKQYTVPMSETSAASLTPSCLLGTGKAGESTVTVTAAPEEPESPGNGGDQPANPGNPGNGGDNGSGDGDNPVGTPDEGNKPPLDDKDPVASDKVPAPEDDDKATDDSDSAVGDSNDPNSSTTPAGDVEAVDTSNVNEGSSGMLALLATVCLVGVGVAAARTMISNRGSAA